MTDDSAGIGLLDTSVLIAAEEGRQLRAEALPKSAAISIVTVGELRAGILAAPDIQSRDRRLHTFERISGTAILPVDHRVAQIWAGMRAYLAASGERVSGNDLWIAATAAAGEMPVVTQDRDFHALSGVNGLTVIEV
ncbi:MAG TPA: PIN domain-containing protein [Solirubrobacterales bacterium]|nr:PIN domain-containing protein [Solirubrobacterales bacterium]